MVVKVSAVERHRLGCLLVLVDSAFGRSEGSQEWC